MDHLRFATYLRLLPASDELNANPSIFRLQPHEIAILLVELDTDLRVNGRLRRFVARKPEAVQWDEAFFDILNNLSDRGLYGDHGQDDGVHEDRGR